MIKWEWTAREGARLIKFLAKRGMPRSDAMRALKNRDIRINGSAISKDEQVEPGDKIVAYWEPRLDIAYMDEEFIIPDKPQGLPTNGEDSLETLLGALYPGARACHRLDAQTGGLVIFARTENAYEEMSAAMKRGELKKVYQCAVVGRPERQSAELRAYLRKNAKTSIVKIFDSPGLGALEILTRYEYMGELARGLSRLRVTIRHGRTHQIRAHLAHVGLPILGDDKYGDRAANRRYGVTVQQLFATELDFSQMTGSLDRLRGVTVRIEPRLKV